MAFFWGSVQVKKLWKRTTVHLEETLQPPNLKDSLSYQHTQLEYRPPLDPRVCAFCCVSVRAFSDDDVGLFVFDLVEEFGELADCGIGFWLASSIQPPCDLAIGGEKLPSYLLLPRDLGEPLIQEHRRCRGR
jgi:hypothetical protein